MHDDHLHLTAPVARQYWEHGHAHEVSNIESDYEDVGLILADPQRLGG